jgi:signal transduction histidine kinase/CheY-like chemotaxis protein
MAHSTLLSSPRTALTSALQGLSEPRPVWGVTTGALFAMAFIGSTPALPLLGQAWDALSSAVLPASTVTTLPTTASAVWLTFCWLIALAGLVVSATGRTQAHRLPLIAGAATAGMVTVSLAARAASGLAVEPILPIAVLLGGVSGRVAFEQWQQAMLRRRSELKRQMQQVLQQAKAEFLGEISREMRTPVNAVLGVADLISETGLDGEQRRHMDVFRRSADALTHLLEDLNDLARIESGRAKLRPGHVSLVPMLHELMGQVRPQAEAKGLQVQLTVATDLPRLVQADPQRLTQVLSHLLHQAVKVTRQGRVQIEVRPHSRDASRVRFAITDTSLSPITGKLAGMLEPFGQAGAAGAPKSTGIGQSLARRVAELMGGKLSVRHSPGKGSTTVFSVPLPAVSEADPGAVPSAATLSGAAASAQVAAATVSVLLVDDNLSTRHLIESMLDKRHYAVVSCANGREALQALEIAPYDVVLMDLNMPEMDGWSALRVIRRLETERNTRRTPVIALGMASFEVERQRCLDAGFDQHLSKPLRKSRLIDSIAHVIQAAQNAPAPAATSARTGALRFDQRDALSLLASEGLIDVRTSVESLGGDASLYLDAVEHLAPALANWPRRFRETLDRRDFDRARQMATDMQGILEVMGAGACAAALGRMAAALQKGDDLAAHARQLGDLEQHLHPLMQTLQTAVERLRSARTDRSRREQGHNSAF